MSPRLRVTIDKEYDKEIIGAFLDERDDVYDFGYERIIKEHPALAECRGMGEKKNAYVAQKGFANLENNWDLAEIFNVVVLGLPAFVKITGKADEGYAQHEKYFAYYKALWRRSETLDAYLERANSEGLVSTT